ncbi:histidinol-phosphatase [Paracoccus tegillarcae]|uniref:Histidinol-phosphatase n=1 Tax=Paracoccus tegillarcae TaxID=1529068 RepID=A0A2K9ETE5_9RHOB|nr:histidinol-phosphatase [Paracoccus tegillarcae]AUH34106.1 histidinol-phosphatase [Paracoccus tegillarcae]
MTDDRNDIMATAHLLADAARAEILPYFRRSDLHSENKLSTGFDPVTEADKAAERAMRQVLAERRPDDAVIGEEYGTSAGTSGIRWILDPIDGTRAFICGAPSWGVLIGVGNDAGLTYGIIDQPYTGERFEGGFGRARLIGPRGEEPLRTRRGVALSDATLMTTFPEVGTAEDGAAFQRVAAKARLTRYGLDCYAYALLALGHIDLVIESGLHVYDIAAPLAVVQAAGGVVTDWQGGSAEAGGRVIAAASPEIHAAALDFLQG